MRAIIKDERPLFKKFKSYSAAEIIAAGGTRGVIAALDSNGMTQWTLEPPGWSRSDDGRQWLKTHNNSTLNTESRVCPKEVRTKAALRNRQTVR